jgi:hypothetical protein
MSYFLSAPKELSLGISVSPQLNPKELYIQYISSVNPRLLTEELWYLYQPPLPLRAKLHPLVPTPFSPKSYILSIHSPPEELRYLCQFQFPTEELQCSIM